MLAGTVVDETTINLEKENNFKGKVHIPNYSIVAFELVSLLNPVLRSY